MANSDGAHIVDVTIVALRDQPGFERWWRLLTYDERMQILTPIYNEANDAIEKISGRKENSNG